MNSLKTVFLVSLLSVFSIGSLSAQDNPDTESSSKAGLCHYWGEIGMQIHQDMRNAKARNRANYMAQMEEMYELENYGEESAAFRNYQSLFQAADNGASAKQLFELAVTLCRGSDSSEELLVDKEVAGDLEQSGVCSYWQKIASNVHDDARRVKARNPGSFLSSMKDLYQVDRYATGSTSHRIYMALINAADRGESKARMSDIALGLCSG